MPAEQEKRESPQSPAVVYSKEEIQKRIRGYQGGLIIAKSRREELLQELEELNASIERTLGGIQALSDLASPDTSIEEEPAKK